MSNQAMKKHEVTLSAYYYVKEAGVTRLHTMIPNIWHSGKGKIFVRTTEIVVVARDFKGGSRWIGEAEGIFRAVNYSVWHNGGNMTCIHQNLWNCTTERVILNINYEL